MKEQWIKWEPVEGLAAYRDLEIIAEDSTRLKIVLYHCEDDTKTLQVTFDKSIDAYRSTNESYLFNTMGYIEKSCGQPLFRAWTIFKVANSNYLKTFLNLSSDIKNTAPFIHFSFLTTEEFIDVIATYEPTFKFITEEGKK